MKNWVAYCPAGCIHAGGREQDLAAVVARLDAEFTPKGVALSVIEGQGHPVLDYVDLSNPEPVVVPRGNCPASVTKATFQADGVDCGVIAGVPLGSRVTISPARPEFMTEAEGSLEVSSHTAGALQVEIKPPPPYGVGTFTLIAQEPTP